MSVLFQKRELRKLPSFFTKLKRLRLSRHRSLEELEEKTKVKLEYLKALEEGRISDLPGEVYVVSFLRQYLSGLEIDPNPYWQQFQEERRDLFLDNKSPLILEGKALEPSFYLTPKIILGMAVGVFVISIVVYIWLGVRNFVSPPPLFVDLPDQTKVQGLEIIVKGQTASFANLLINNQPIVLDKDGRFQQKITLNNGLNTIQVIAKNRLNKETTKTIQVLAYAGF